MIPDLYRNIISILYNLLTLFLGDGIFDKISSKEGIECVWNSVRDAKQENVH